MKTILPVHTPTPLLLPIVLTLGALLASIAPGRAAAFVPGEILVDELSGPSIQRYSAGGTLLQTFTGTGLNWEGAALTPDGNLVTAYGSPTQGINIFSPSGTQTTTFTATGNSFRGDVSVFANGTLALGDQHNDTVQFWSQAGVLLQTVSVPGFTSPLGSTVGSDGILYVGGNASKNIARLNSNGVSLGNIGLSFSPGDLVMNPVDGTLWICGVSNGLVSHIQTDGTVLGSFATGLPVSCVGIGLAPDNNSLYVTSTTSTVVKHFDLSGNLLGSFALTSPSNPAFITVVPAAAPEPASATLLLGGLALLAARRCRVA